MRATGIAIALCGSVMGCGQFAPNAAEGASAITQGEAITLPPAALADPSATHGNPARAARAIAAEDWLAGQSTLTPEFGEYGPADAWRWRQLRSEVRASIGVAPQAPSPQLVARLLAAQTALDAGDTAAARQQLQPPIFTLGPDGTLAALSDLPGYRHLRPAYAELRRNEGRPFGPNQFTYR